MYWKAKISIAPPTCNFKSPVYSFCQVVPRHVQGRFWKLSPLPRREASQLTNTLCFTHRSFAGKTECTISEILVFRLFSLPCLFFLYMQFVLSACFISNNRTSSNLACEKTTVPHYFYHQKHSLNKAQNFLRNGLLHSLANIYMFSRNGTRVQKGCQSMCNIDVTLCCQKIKDQTILAALIANHTPTVTSCNGTSWMNMEFSAYQYVLLLRNHLPTSIKLS